MSEVVEGFRDLKHFLAQERAQRNAELIPWASGELEKIGCEFEVVDETCIRISYKGRSILFYPRSGWYSGKGVGSGRGWGNLKRILTRKDPK